MENRGTALAMKQLVLQSDGSHLQGYDSNRQQMEVNVLESRWCRASAECFVPGSSEILEQDFSARDPPSRIKQERDNVGNFLLCAEFMIYVWRTI